MSISTYAELQTAIANWMNRSTLTDRIPEFIALVEGEANRILILDEMKHIATATYAPGSRFMGLPSGLMELLDLQVKVYGAEDRTYKPVRQVGPENITRYYEGSSSAGPTHYCKRDQLEFNREVSSNHTLRMHYLKRWNIASDSTNWLLTNFPDLYLCGAMVAAEMYVKNDKRFPSWEKRFYLAVDQLNELNERSQDDTTMTSELFGMESRGGARFNVIQGA